MNIPDPASRDRIADLKTLTKVVIHDFITFNDEKLNVHIAETPDLLIAYVERAIGLSVRINWSEVKDTDLPAIKAWQDYCGGLFDGVQGFINECVESR